MALIKCPECGKKVSTMADSCPRCGYVLRHSGNNNISYGGMNEPVIYTPPKQGPSFFQIVLTVAGIIAVIALIKGGAFSDTPIGKKIDTFKSSKTESVSYTSYDVSTMINDLSQNPLTAASKYKGQYIRVTGRLNVIDSSGKYIALYPDQISIQGVQCYIKNDTQRSQVSRFSIGDTVTVRGKCFDVGEVIGYQLNIDDIE